MSDQGPADAAPRRAATRRVRTLQRLVAALEHGAARVEAVADRARLATRRRIGHAGSIAVLGYRGFGTAAHLHLMGRVVEAPRVTVPALGDSRRRNLARTLRHFLSREIPGCELEARAGAQTVSTSADEEGYFRATLDAAAHGWPTGWSEIGLTLTECPLPGWAPTSARAEVLVPRADARFAVVSDIDDTVLQSHVTHTMRMLWVTLSGNAFTRLPFEGTSELYRALGAGPSGPAHNPFFYVSKSPWNLYDFLVEFLAYQSLPKGPIFLRDVGLHHEAPLDFKTTTIAQLFAAYPALPFVLIGDSGERDPDIYVELATRHPGRVRAIYIREVTGSARKRRPLDALAEEARRAGTELLLVAHASEALAHARGIGLVHD